MDINVKCPYCNQITGYDNSRPFAYCMLCGKQISLAPQPANDPVSAPVNVPVNQAPVTYSAPVSTQVPVQNYAGGPNLIITYYSEHPRVFLITTILATGACHQYSNGQSMAFNLVPGIHAINFKIGKRTYRRDILINPNQEPVRVVASWGRGTARINIINPSQPGNAPIMYI
ncbi:MAG: hypothetical protein K5881_01920 [Saccharofermentans sp.]|nr:hypothetical protein [Saccharofermentans sp.]